MESVTKFFEPLWKDFLEWGRMGPVAQKRATDALFYGIYPGALVGFLVGFWTQNFSIGLLLFAVVCIILTVAILFGSRKFPDPKPKFLENVKKADEQAEKEMKQRGETWLQGQQ